MLWYECINNDNGCGIYDFSNCYSIDKNIGNDKVYDKIMIMIILLTMIVMTMLKIIIIINANNHAKMNRNEDDNDIYNN